MLDRHWVLQQLLLWKSLIRQHYGIFAWKWILAWLLVFDRLQSSQRNFLWLSLLLYYSSECTSAGRSHHGLALQWWYGSPSQEQLLLICHKQRTKVQNLCTRKGLAPWTFQTGTLWVLVASPCYGHCSLWKSEECLWQEASDSWQATWLRFHQSCQNSLHTIVQAKHLLTHSFLTEQGLYSHVVSLESNLRLAWDQTDARLLFLLLCCFHLNIFLRFTWRFLRQFRVFTLEYP